MSKTRLRKFIDQVKKPENRKKLFWYWVGYQAIKGTLTTSFIWIPLILAALHLK